MMLHDEKERGPKAEKPYKNWREIEVESDYTGPRLEEKGEVTSEWYKIEIFRVINLMEYFKDQKKLHKRYALQLIEICKDRVWSYSSLVDYSIGD
jgi:serine/threonine-protein phosphatase 5